MLRSLVSYFVLGKNFNLEFNFKCDLDSILFVEHMTISVHPLADS